MKTWRIHERMKNHRRVMREEPELPLQEREGAIKRSEEELKE